MEPISVDVVPLDSWPEDRLRSAYRLISRRVAAVLELPADHPDRASLPRYRAFCEDAGMELVRRGLA